MEKEKRKKAVAHRSCMLCGKLGKVALVEAIGEAETDPLWRLEIMCPDACDIGGTGEENILFSSQDIEEVEEWARANGIDFDSLEII